jgi:hypothetical protein
LITFAVLFLNILARVVFREKVKVWQWWEQ